MNKVYSFLCNGFGLCYNMAADDRGGAVLNGISVVIFIFSLLGAIDYIIGNKIGIGKEFQRAFSMFGAMALTMLGMLVIVPAIGIWLTPALETFYAVFHIDPSVIPASLFANDMGGLVLAQTVAKSESVGNYSAFIISSMMGAVVSYTIPVSLSLVKQEQHKELFYGLLCGIATIPIGCFVGGLMCGLPAGTVFLTLLPLTILSGLVAMALVLIPSACIRFFSAFGFFVKLLGMIGLVCAVFTYLTKIEIHPHFDSLENAAFVCVSASVTLSGTLPMMFLVGKLLRRPLNTLGAKLNINAISTLALLGTLVSNTPTLGMMEQMDKKGVVLNAAFAVSAAFMLGAHLAFTMAIDSNYVPPMIVSKLISGLCALALALVLYKDSTKAETVSK